MKQRFARLTLAGACIALVAGSLLPSAASGATVADKKAQAQQLMAEIDANGEKISMLAEQYNGAQIALEHRMFKSPGHRVFLVRALVGLESYVQQLGTVTNWRRVFSEGVDRARAAARPRRGKR